jgi:hypothetical protein
MKKDVKVIDTKGASALVESDDSKRVYVPEDTVKEGKASSTALERGIPHGVPWEKLDKGVAKELRAAGIWTQADLSSNQRVAWEIARAHKVDLADLNRLAAKGG